MPRTTLTALAAIGSYGFYTTANSADLTMTAADISNLNEVRSHNNQIVIAFNSGASPATLVFSPHFDPYNRRGNTVGYSLGAGKYAVFGPFKLVGWEWPDSGIGKLYFQSDTADVKFGIVNLPE